MRVKGSVAIITGGAWGLGKAFSEALLLRGGEVRQYTAQHLLRNTKPYLFSSLILSRKTKFEPQHDKTNTVECAPSEDSDQPGHLGS